MTVTRILQRRGTAASWATSNPILGPGEVGRESDTKRTKTGDGATAWNALAYDQTGVTKADVGLGNADNTSDVNKPVSTAQAAAIALAVSTAVVGLLGGAASNLDTLEKLGASIAHDPAFATTMNAALALKAPLASPALTGIPTVPTAALGTNTTQAASTAFVRAEVAALVAAAPGTLDTLNELAAALGNDPSFAATTAASLALKAPLASPALTGTPTGPTAALDANTTQLANTAWFVGQASAASPLMAGTAAVGTSLRWARADHVHPTDTSRAPLASPALTGVPTGPTAAADTNTTQLATTAFYAGQASSSSPLMAGLAAIGTSLRFARADHVHPTDTSRAPTASPTLTGTVTIPTPALDSNTTVAASTAWFMGQGASALPVINGTAAAGSSTRWARADHVHPTDTTRAPLDSPGLTGTPTSTTPATGNRSTRIATTAFVGAELDALVAAAPGTLDTLNELATALGNDPNFATTMVNALALKAPLASPALTGSPTAPTPAAGNSSTLIATTAFVAGEIATYAGTVTSALALKAPLDSPTFTTGVYSTGQVHRITHTQGALQFYKDGTPTKAARLAFNTAATDSVALGIYDGSAWTNPLIVNAGGRIDVTGTSAGATLEVLRLANAGTGANTKALLGFNATGTQYAQILGGYGAASPQMDFVLPTASTGLFTWSLSSAGESMRLSATGLGVGTATPGSRLEVADNAVDLRLRSLDTGDATLRYFVNGTEVATARAANGGTYTIETLGSARFKIDPSGNAALGQGGSINYTQASRTVFEVNGTTETVLALSRGGSSGDYLYSNASGLEISAASTRFLTLKTGGTEGWRLLSDQSVSHTSAAAPFHRIRRNLTIPGENTLGVLTFQGKFDSTSYGDGASIAGIGEGSAWSSTSTPAYLAFATTAVNATSATTRLKIAADGMSIFYRNNETIRLQSGVDNGASYLTFYKYSGTRNGFVGFGDSSSNLYVWNDNNASIYLGTNNATAVTIAPSGAASFTQDLSVAGLRVGKGAGAVSNNTAAGVVTLNANTTGSQNTAFGYAALAQNTTANYNTGVGTTALYTNTTGAQNTALGAGALYANTTGSLNLAAGADALIANTIGAYNVAVGGSTLRSNLDGNYSVAVGYGSLYSEAVSGGQVAVGAFALQYHNGTAGNTAVGYEAGRMMTNGGYNTLIGHAAGASLTGGDSGNTIVGYNLQGAAGYANVLQIGTGAGVLIEYGTGSPLKLPLFSTAAAGVASTHKIAVRLNDGSTIYLLATT